MTLDELTAFDGDDECEAPTREAMEAARRVMAIIESEGMPPLDWSIPNGGGGVVFAWGSSREIEINRDGTVEWWAQGERGADIDPKQPEAIRPLLREWKALI